MATLYAYIDTSMPSDTVFYSVNDPSTWGSHLVIHTQEVDIPEFTRDEIKAHRNASAYVTARNELIAAKARVSQAEEALRSLESKAQEVA